MDMSFALKPRRPASRWVVSLADIKVAADRQRTNACGTITDFLRGQDGESDPIHVLACTIMPETDGLIDTVTLSGSFNPLVAHQLMVGKKG
jgi:hypothetical protein